jgi:hypothetical protein
MSVHKRVVVEISALATPKAAVSVIPMATVLARWIGQRQRATQLDFHHALARTQTRDPHKTVTFDLCFFQLTKRKHQKAALGRRTDHVPWSAPGYAT